MAVAAGSALLRSVATKTRGMAAVSPRARQPFTSSSSAPSSSTKNSSARQVSNDGLSDLSQNKNVPGELHSAKPAYVKIKAQMPHFVMLGCAAFLYFWVNPRAEELVNEVNALRREVNSLRRERSILIKAMEDCQRTHIQDKGHGKESDGQKAS